MSRPFTRSQAKRPLSPSAAAAASSSAPAQRARVQQDGDAAAASSSSRLQPAAAAAFASLSIAQRCHTDALHCILAFLWLEDVAIIVQVCHAWQAAAMKERPRESIQYRTKSVIRNCSLIRKHMVNLRMQREVQPADILQLHQLPMINELSCTVSAKGLKELLEPQHAELKAAFVARAFTHPLISSLSLRMTVEHTLDMWQLLLESLPSGAARIGRIDLLGSAPPAGVDWTPLLRMHELRCIAQDTLYAPELCTVIKQLPLIHLGIHRQYVPVDWLTALLEPPHKLHNLVYLHVDFTAETLPLVEGLKQLSGLSLQCDDTVPYELLAHTPRVSEVTLRFMEDMAPEHVERLHSALRQCTRIYDLTIYLSEDSSPHASTAMLSRVLAATPRLWKFELLRSPLDSLSFLQHTSKLQQLEVDCFYASFADAEFLQLTDWTPKLQSLFVRSNSALSDEVREALKPPSLLLPHLHDFTWWQYEDPDDREPMHKSSFSDSCSDWSDDDE